MSTAIDRTLAALADPDRRRAVELLGRKARAAGELAKALGLAAPAMSRHLRTLKDAGLVDDAHPAFDARVRIYSLKAGAMEDLMDWLAKTERMWGEQLAAFKALVEKKGS